MNIDNSNLDSVICGDFNIDYQKINQDGSPASTLNSIISAYNFTQTINQLTRVTEKSSTTIDLTLTNCVNKITSGVAIVSVADHLMNFAIYGDKKTIHHHKYVTSRNYKKMNENKLLQDLQRVPWSTIEIIDDIDEAWSIWKSLFRQVIDQHAPIRKFRAKQSQCKWHTEEIEELKLVRDEYHSRAINNQDPHDWAVYRKLRNRCTNMSRNIKKQYFQDEIKKSKNSSKTMWTCLKQLLPQSSKASVTTLDIGGKLISTAQGVADEVNSFFTNIGKQLANKIPSQDTSHKHYLNRQEPITSTFLFSPITSADVHKHLSELDITKATGPDDIPSRLLKLSAPVISDSLAFLFNFSLISGKFPAEWKIAKVSAIFKKGSKLDIGNYRPISVLPILSKVLEKLVHLQVYKYLQDNNILKREQSGFRSKHSTQTSLHYILEDIYKRTNNCEMVGLVALDLRKAFDTVDHQILMDKLSHYGIYEQWFKSYISDRKQFTSVDGKFSSSLDIKTGVPQGSILGPLLFILYLNDLPTALTHCQSNMYADDTAFYTSSVSTNVINVNLQSDLASVSTWLNANKLSLHIGKTSCMFVCSRQKRQHVQDPFINLTLNDQVISQVECIDYLGVKLDQNLSFDPHVDRVIAKISRALGVLKRVSPFIDQDTKLTLFNTIVLPHFDYCSTVWDICSENHINKLQRLQNRAMRIILGCKFRTHITDMLSTLKWLNVRQRLLLHKCVLMYKIVNKITPEYLSNVAVGIGHSYSTRGKFNNNLNRSHQHVKSLANKGTILWNSLPASVKNHKTIPAFKKSCIHYILGNHNIY